MDHSWLRGRVVLLDADKRVNEPEMKVSTKYGMDDHVFVVHRGRAHRGKISGIQVSITRVIKIVYTVILEAGDGHGEFDQDAVFETKEQLKESL